MEQKPSIGPDAPVDYAAMVEEIRQLREDVAEANQPRGIFGRLKARAKRTGTWFINGLAPVGDSDEVEKENAAVQFLERKMRTRRGKAGVLLVSATVFVFWGIILLQIMR